VKIVLDTNIWISSLLLPQSNSGKIIKAWRNAQFKIVTSDPILEEIKEVLTYPKIFKRLKMSPVLIDEYILFLRFFTEVIQLKQNNALHDIAKLRDPEDSHVLFTFLESESNYLVTGDKDLLAFNHDYPILTPSDFCQFL